MKNNQQQTHSGRDKDFREALLWEYFTVAYNFIEAVFSIFFGRLSGSIALVGFGLDSVVESLSGLILIWRLKKHKLTDKAHEDAVEQRAQVLVGFTFFILGAYILFQSLRKLLLKEMPDPSLPGIIIALLSIIIMPFLAQKKYQLGIRINSRALKADSKETLACSFLSAALLIGLGLNFLFGWWYADSLTGLIIVVFLFREGWETLKIEKD